MVTWKWLEVNYGEAPLSILRVFEEDKMIVVEICSRSASVLPIIIYGSLLCDLVFSPIERELVGSPCCHSGV